MKNKKTKETVKHELFSNITITEQVATKGQKVNWNKIPIGTKFICKIHKKRVSGRIFKEDDKIYFCQNNNKGNKCSNLLGYDFSWSVYDGSPEHISNNSVEIISLKLDEKFVIPEIPKIIKIDGNLVEFYDDHLIVGCSKVKITKVEKILALHKEGRRND